MSLITVRGEVLLKQVAGPPCTERPSAVPYTQVAQGGRGNPRTKNRDEMLRCVRSGDVVRAGGLPACSETAGGYNRAGAELLRVGDGRGDLRSAGWVMACSWCRGCCVRAGHSLYGHLDHITWELMEVYVSHRSELE